MSESSRDEGVVVALMKRFNEQRLPRALELKARVEKGERLGEPDIAFLDEVFRDASHVMPVIDRHPELESIATRAISLYKEITSRALENEKQS